MTVASLAHLAVINHSDEELGLAWCRYHALKQLKPHQMIALTKSQLEGRDFDELVDRLVLTFAKKTI